MSAVDPIVGVRNSLDQLPMRRGQVIAVVFVVFLAALDGYDVQSMSFVAPVVSKAWSIDKASLGLVLASSLFGMAGGSLGLSPLADLFGRRPIVMAGTLLMTVGSLLSALSHSVPALALSRAVTGLGIGVLVPLTTTIAAEFANAQRRAIAVAATTVGFSLGGVAGGLIAAAILKHHPWLWVFGCGAVAGTVMLFSASLLLPESPTFLMDRRKPDSLDRLNRVLLRFGREPLTALPQPPFVQHTSYRALFTSDMASTTIQFAVVYMLIATSAYYLLSWLPQLVVDAGFPASTASLVSATSILVGVPAGLGFGVLAGRLGPRRLASGAMIGFGVTLAVLGIVPAALWPLLFAASACGFFLAATTAVFYATMTSSFPPLTRVSGIGLVMGCGRLLSGLGPYLAGVMFAAGLTRSAVSFVFAAVAIAAGILLATGHRRERR